VTVAATPSQTIGPFFLIGLCRPETDGVMPGGTERIEGRVLDGAGEPVADALVEIWHADAGWARCGTDADGRFAFLAGRAPHLEVLVFARGLLKPVLTRMYFTDHDDPVLSALSAADRATLVAERDGDALRFDIRLQGERQTVFFTL
jgi:protocatechuate 3,4-dioxygenase alpha subunit